MTKVLEGTWEEIAAHKEEWNGKRLRVAIEVLDAANLKQNGAGAQDSAEQARLRATLMEIVGTVSGLPEDLSEDTGRKFGDIVQEKYERGKL